MRDIRLSMPSPPSPAYYDAAGRGYEVFVPMGPHKTFCRVGCIHVFAGDELVETRLLVLAPGGMA